MTCKVPPAKGTAGEWHRSPQLLVKGRHRAATTPPLRRHRAAIMPRRHHAATAPSQKFLYIVHAGSAGNGSEQRMGDLNGQVLANMAWALAMEQANAQCWQRWQW